VCDKGSDAGKWSTPKGWRASEVRREGSKVSQSLRVFAKIALNARPLDPEGAGLFVWSIRFCFDPDLKICTKNMQNVKNKHHEKYAHF
jgi:hypothetical protein